MVIYFLSLFFVFMLLGLCIYCLSMTYFTDTVTFIKGEDWDSRVWVINTLSHIALFLLLTFCIRNITMYLVGTPFYQNAIMSFIYIGGYFAFVGLLQLAVFKTWYKRFLKSETVILQLPAPAMTEPSIEETA